MSSVKIEKVEVQNNPAKFTDNIVLDVVFNCTEEIKHDVEWKLTYIGSSSGEEFDQVLDSVLVGPVPIGMSKFTFDAPAPDASKIPEDDLIGATVILLTGSYNGREFVRVGYYVNIEYESDELKENPPATPQIDKLVRNILEKPRVTTFPIQWDSDEEK